MTITKHVVRNDFTAEECDELFEEDDWELDLTPPPDNPPDWFDGLESYILEQAGSACINHLTARMYLEAKYFRVICNNCSHVGVPDGQCLVARGLGDTPLLRLKFKCPLCGSTSWRPFAENPPEHEPDNPK